MYYINPNTSEVHRRGACSWQDTIANWTYLGNFATMSAAVTFARSNGYPSATRCEHCVD